MGYESKLYVIKKGSVKGSSGKIYGMHVAAFEMGCVYEMVGMIKKYPHTDTFFFADDGNTEVTSDAYGEPLTEIPVKDMANIIRGLSEHDVYNVYRRYKPVLAFLDAIDESEWHNIVVLHYGH